MDSVVVKAILVAWGMPNVTSGEQYERAVAAAKVAGSRAIRAWAEKYEAEWGVQKTGGMWRKRRALDSARSYADALER